MRNNIRKTYLYFVYHLKKKKNITCLFMLHIVPNQRSYTNAAIPFDIHFRFHNHLSMTRTFLRSFIDPRPNTAILHIVSSCSLFIELPFGPSNLPTKLNWFSCNRISCAQCEKGDEPNRRSKQKKTSLLAIKFVKIGARNAFLHDDRFIHLL